MQLTINKESARRQGKSRGVKSEERRIGLEENEWQTKNWNNG